MEEVVRRAAVRRFIFWISYDGSRFAEMARGGTGLGVMDLLGQTLKDSLFGRRPSMSLDHDTLRLSPSSRTDAGVHAVRNAIIAQVPLRYGDLDHPVIAKVERLAEFNNTLENSVPGGMKILDFHRVSAGFCIRRNVSYRRYTYRLAVVRDWDLRNSLKLDPSTVCFSEKDYAWRLPPGFDPMRARDACDAFIGEQVMGSFFKHTNREKAKEPNPPNALRNILHVGISKGEPYSVDNDIYYYYNVSVVAKSFVREQIRRMMSCIVYHGYDRLPMTTIQWLLRNPISSNFYDIRLPVAPASGLFLTDVVYDPLMFSDPIPYHKHSWDYEYSVPNIN